jgi:segregation and condensation protein B
MSEVSFFLASHVEALIFCSQVPLSKAQIRSCLSEMLEAEVPENDIDNTIAYLTNKYNADDSGICIEQTGGGYQMLTKPSCYASVNILLQQNSKKKLSNAALETIAIIAYKQPLTKAQLEQIRGVGCDYAIQKLLEKELIEIKGKADTAGRPILYGTSQKFMDYFGINSLKDLPQPKDFPAEMVNEIGNSGQE